MTDGWFAVSKEGLAKLIEARGRGFAVLELISNGWDQRVTQVDVTLTPADKRGYYRVHVNDDDPNGFANLRDAFTLFGETAKRHDSEKRGRFNLGEKLALALCSEAKIITTTGTICFDADGKRRQTKEKRERGSEFTALIKMNKPEYDETVATIRQLLTPPNIVTTFNGEGLTSRPMKHTLILSLPTPLADAEGVMRMRTRQCEVQVFEPLAGQPPMLYEMGIPVVETNDRYDLNVCQKVPLNPDRDNVPPSYLRTIRTAVVNALYTNLTPTDATTTWVKEAASDPRCTVEATEAILTQRFGEKRVSYDPTDPEANKRAVAAGYTVIPGGALSAGEWKNAKAAQAVLPAGQVTPGHHVDTSPDGKSTIIPEEEWTPPMRTTGLYLKRLMQALLGGEITVRISRDVLANYAACWGQRELTLNLGRLGRAWFETTGSDDQHELLLHEVSHHDSGDHLSDHFHDAISKYGAKLTRLAVEQPELFRVPARVAA